MKSVIRIINLPSVAMPIKKTSDIPVGTVFTGVVKSTNSRWPGMYVRAGSQIFSLSTPGDWFHATLSNDMEVENFKQVDITVEVNKVYDQG